MADEETKEGDHGSETNEVPGKLLAVLEKTRAYAEKVFAETGYSKEVAFNEFYIWWYHFIYTRATDLMAEAGMLKVPPDGNFLYEMLDR